MRLSLFSRFWSAAMRRGLLDGIEQVALFGAEHLINQPTLFYLNHHTHFDGHLVWLMIYEIRQRRGVVWMERWEDFPFLGLLGGLPFPRNQPKAQIETMNRTVELLDKHPDWDFYIFPEARQHPPEEGVLPFSPKILQRLSRKMPHLLLCPVAIHVTWWTGERPTLLLKVGEAHNQPDGREAERLQELLHQLTQPQTASPRIVLSHPIKPNRNFRWMRYFFRHYPK
ncbi:MAG: 1-acyl-sn-glycerol-3-phosphate acyltransferase [Bacteroidetes Order II. Incertae sedis bacterium]|nr:1-acyl-sn-glycerol-3-phosphate acyltransferase [Bacteroidetes Order II. bacterium]